ncbi:MAG: T9SS type A sorting domain-containing protein [Tannerella sp.]|jgi:hypothetical protein|nr:T9SS type A sorting domain-containing protein [Tannerella sp.]
MRKFTKLMMLAVSIFATQTIMGLTYHAVVPAGTKACYITGDPTGGWGTFAKMVKVDDTHYTIELENAAETGEYKYYSGPDWDYEESITEVTDGAPDFAGFTAHENRKYSDAAGLDTVLYWKSVFTPEVKNLTLDCLVPANVQLLYITGSFNGWSGVFGDDQKMIYAGEEDGGKVFTFELTTENPGGLEFKFVAGPDWAYEQSASDNFKLSDGTTYEIDKYAFNVHNFKAVYDSTKAGFITITATVPAVGDNVWIQGSLFGWNWDDPDAHLMTKNQDGTFSFTTPKPVQSMEYRLYNAPDWSNPEQEFDDASQEWKEKSNRAVNFETDGANVSITVCKWANGDGGTLCGGTTAVDEMDRDYFTIVAYNKQIVVSNVLSRVEIFDITGKMLEAKNLAGSFTSARLSKGIYLVRVDGFTKKVLVK